MFQSTRSLAWLITILLVAVESARAQKPDLVVQLGHSGPIETVSYSRDGQTLASGGHDMSIKLWDVASGLLLRTLKGHTHWVSSVCYSPDSRTIASGSADSTIKLWDVASGDLLRTLMGHSSWVRSVSFSPDGRTLASGSWDGTIKLWDIGSGRPLKTYSPLIQIYSVSFSPDGRTLACGAEDGTVMVWDIGSNRQLKTFRGHSQVVNTVSYSPDGRTVASGTEDGLINLWDISSGSSIKTLKGHSGAVLSVSYSPDGRTLASGSWDYTIKLWDVTSGLPLQTLEGHSNIGNPYVLSVSYSPDGRTLASGSLDNSVKVWDVANGHLLRKLVERSDEVWSLSCSSDGQRLASGSRTGSIKLWDVANGHLLRTIPIGSNYVNTLSYSPNGKMLASASSSWWEASIKVWDAADGHLLQKLDGHSNYVSSLSYSPNGQTLASGSGDSTIMLWDVASGQPCHTLKGHTGVVWCVGFSPDGRTLASGSADKTIRLWNATNGRLLRTLKKHIWSVSSLSFSPDGRTLASGSYDNTVTLWNAANGRPLFTLEGHTDEVTSVCYSSNGRTLASGSRDRTIKIWDVASGRLLHTLDGHSDEVTSVRSNPIRQTLFSGSNDGTIKLWNTSSGALIATLVSVGDSGWVAIDSTNFYTSSRAALPVVAFRVGLRAYPFDQFDLRLNRPDKVLESLGNPDTALISAYRSAYYRRLAKMGFTDSIHTDNYHLPELDLTSNALPSSTRNHTVTLPVRAWDSDSIPLNRLNVYVNNVAVYGTDGITLHHRTSPIDTTLRVELTPGRNKVQVSVVNDHLAESLKQTYEVTYEPPASHKRKPALHVVAIGVSDYPTHALKFADRDADSLAHYFTTARSEFDQVDTLILTNASATRDNILALRNRLMDTRPEDEVILSFSGHGLLDSSLNFYFGAYGVDFDNPRQGGVSYDEIESLLDGIPARKKLLLLDACHSGEDDGRGRPSGPGLKILASSRGVEVLSSNDADSVGLEKAVAVNMEIFADLRRGTGAHVISAAGAKDYAYEFGGNGAFTRAVIDGLRGAAPRDKEGRLTVSSLRNYVFDEVMKKTGNQQRPTSRRENIDFDFDLFGRL